MSSEHSIASLTSSKIAKVAKIMLPLKYNANIHGHSQSVQLYATSATISGTKFGQETHIASTINVVTQVFHYLPRPNSSVVSVYTGHTLQCTLCIHCSGARVAPV